MAGNQFQSKMKRWNKPGWPLPLTVFVVISGQRRLRWRVIFVDPHVAVCVFPVLYHHLVFLFLLSRLLFFLNYHHHLAPLNRPILLPLLPHLFNSVLAFTTKSLDPRTQRAQVLFVPTHDLHTLDATGFCNASCFYALASCLDLFRCFGWALHTIPGLTQPVLFRVLCACRCVMGCPGRVHSGGARHNGTQLVL